MKKKAIWIGALALAALVGFVANDVWRGMERENAAAVTAMQPSPGEAAPATDRSEEYRIEADGLRESIETRNASIKAAAKRLDWIFSAVEAAEPAARAAPDLDIKPVVEMLQQEAMSLIKEMADLSHSNRLDAIEWPVMAGMAGQTNATLEYLVHDHFSAGLHLPESITLTAE